MQRPYNTSNIDSPRHCIIEKYEFVDGTTTKVSLLRCPEEKEHLATEFIIYSYSQYFVLEEEPEGNCSLSRYNGRELPIEKTYKQVQCCQCYTDYRFRNHGSPLDSPISGCMKFQINKSFLS